MTRVLKFGGASVANPEKIQIVANLIEEQRLKHRSILVVVSAMGESTDDLLELAAQVSPHYKNESHRRELDMLLSAGERISMALLSIALRDRGLSAVSFTGSQSGILTTSQHGNALIKEIRPIRIKEHLDRGEVVIVAGFQGVSEEKEITTLGRGGSDTSAVALACTLDADEVIFFKDVGAFYNANPKEFEGAQAVAEMPWSLALLCAGAGAQVMHSRALELAWSRKMPLTVSDCVSGKVGSRIQGEKWPSDLRSFFVFQGKRQLRWISCETQEVIWNKLSSMKIERVQFQSLSNGWKLLDLQFSEDSSFELHNFLKVGVSLYINL